MATSSSLCFLFIVPFVIGSTNVTQVVTDAPYSNSDASSTSIATMEPLYYVIIMLALSLCCLLMILIFWLYHQHQYTKYAHVHKSIPTLSSDQIGSVPSSVRSALPSSTRSTNSMKMPSLMQIATFSKNSGTSSPSSRFTMQMHMEEGDEEHSMEMGLCKFGTSSYHRAALHDSDGSDDDEWTNNMTIAGTVDK